MQTDARAACSHAHHHGQHETRSSLVLLLLMAVDGPAHSDISQSQRDSDGRHKGRQPKGSCALAGFFKLAPTPGD